MSEDNNGTKSAAEEFFAKLGLVFSRAGETVYKDFTESCLGTGKTWDNLKKELTETEKKAVILNDFIKHIVKNIGYDISNCESTQLYNLVKDVFIKTQELGVSIKQISNPNIFESIFNDEETNKEDNSVNNGGEINKENNLPTLADLIGTSESKSIYKNNNIEIEVSGKLKEILNLIQEIIDLFKEIADFEWEKLANDGDSFAKFLKEKFISKEFGRKVFDYVFILVLKNAKEVFADDVGTFIAPINELESKLKELEEKEAKSDEDAKEEEKTLKNIKNSKIFGAISEKIGGNQPENQALEVIHDICHYYQEICTLQNSKQDSAPPQLSNGDIDVPPEIAIKVCQEKLNALLEEYLPSYNSTAKIFNRIYAILHLFGIISKETVKLDEISNKDTSDNDTQTDFDSGESTKTTEILVFHWDLIETLFKNPLNYLKQIFPLNNIGNIEDLLVRIGIVIRSFNSDFPEFKDMRQFVLELYYRIKDRFDKQIGEIEEEAKESFKNLKLFIRKIIEVINNIIEKITTSVKNIISFITDESKGFLKNLENALPFNNDDESLKKFQEIFFDTFKEAVTTTITRNYARKNVGEVLHLDFNSFKDTFKNCSGNIKKNFNSINLKECFEGAILNFEKEINPKSIEPAAFSKALCKTLSNSIISKIQEPLKDSEDIVKTFISDLTEIGKDTQALAKEILSIWVKNITQKIYDLVIRPYITQVIKQWITQVITEWISTEHKAITAAEEVTHAILEILDFITEEEKPSVGDGIKFAVNFYKAIPSEIKKYISDLIELPECIKYIQIPEHTLDVENKFFAVTLWHYKPESNANEIKIQLCIFIGKNDNQDGIYICPIVNGTLGNTINVGQNHTLKAQVTVELNKSSNQNEQNKKEVEKALKNGKIGFFLSNGPTITPVCDIKELSASFELLFSRKQQSEQKPEQKPVQVPLFNTNIADLTIGNYPQKIFAGYLAGKFDLGFSSSLENLNLKLKLKELNSFFETLFSEDIEINLEELAIAYSLQEGLKIENKAYAKIPFQKDIDLKFVKFKDLAMDIGLDNGNFKAGVQTTFIADLQCVSFTFADLGLGVNCNLFTPDGKPGTLKANPQISYPTSISINVDASAVKGSGFIQWQKEKHRFVGALELNILEKFGVNTILALTTGEGKDPFSFMGALCVTFAPPIQLGMGFTLTKIGGSLGLNRGIDVDNLRSAVYDGSLSSILFAENIAENFDKVLANVDKYYPITEDQMYFGLLGQIKKETLLSADFGLFIQAPDPITIIAAGTVRIRQTDSNEKMIAINANFMGCVQIDKGLSFDASLVDSKLVGIDVYGDMAMRIYWGGDTKGFILSIGGFHPQYKPESGFNLVDMKRMGMKLNRGAIKMSLEAYFAITSNTVQFGSTFNITIGWKKFGLVGNASFNALFHFKPFSFQTDMSFGLAVKVGKSTLCSTSLSFNLSGPAQWHAKGTASFKVLFVRVKVNFNETWGKKQSDSNRKYIDIFPLYTSAFDDNSNWKTISTDLSDNMVGMSTPRGKDLIVQPNDLISFNQSAVPFSTNLNCYGEDEIGDYKKFEFQDICVGDESLNEHNRELETSSFAPSLTKKMTDSEKLKAPSYESKSSGFKLSADYGYATGASISKGIAPNKQNDSKSEKPLRVLPPPNAEEPPKSNDLTNSQQSNGTNTQTGNSTKKQISRVSLRRSSEGFRRYLKQLDSLCAIQRTQGQFQRPIDTATSNKQV